jgi:hypothetical protein
MSSFDTSQGKNALRREWLIARIVVIGGFAIAFVAALYFGVLVPWVIQPRLQRAALVSRIETLLHAEAQICTMALTNAKNFGIVPQYGQLATPKLAPTDVQGRYLCLAATKVAKYVLAVDLLCRDLKNARCTSLYNVTQADGTVLYQRQR